ncbi:fumarylacetoacetate hydrolase family protein [Streptomyces abyssomicinicus]|uniref:fumarylacetoacetate hydrolase family protein n=1 Tax=Streptomyces abyssomicinicus TaxID=574929 RepID=UPI001C3FE6B6|nr:fumarylacetoacetate hydrolase family protein [Streptomyces abyssomicinicus]
MQYVSFLSPSTGAPTWGVMADGAVYDLGPSGAAEAESLKSAIAAGIVADGRVRLEALTAVAGESEVEYLPVIPDPGKIVCIGVNYRTHLAETGRAAGPAPTVFTRFADSQTGHLCPVAIPSVSTQFDYEGELAVVIGAPAHRVAAEDALAVVAGYCAYNDFTARDWQRQTSQWIPGKNFPATGAMGPFLVPAAEFTDLDSRTLETRVNGERRQSASLGDLEFGIGRLIEHVSGFTPLAPGDVIVTGTPGGVGLFMDPPALLEAGDVVEVEITGLGILCNEIVAEEVRA